MGFGKGRDRLFGNSESPEPSGVGVRDRTWCPTGGKRRARKWAWNESDERAIEAGYLFDEKRAEHFVKVCFEHLLLWEGEYAGKPFEMMKWQRETLMRLFGWVGKSDHYKRWVRRFRKCSLWVPKKNGKSPTGAAIGLYLLKWDGEPGQKVYSAAKDGKQAMIVHKHAQKMVQAMDHPLLGHFGINRSTGVIHYPRENSEYQILGGENIKGQEGLNGSVIIDETHVVDDRLAQVLTDMGASRPEPLQFEISTAGNDPTGYGRKQYEYGRLVEEGRVTDHAFFFKSYEAPQEVTDEEIRADDSIWKEANPAWGHTIDPNEFSNAMTRANRSSSDWSAFKQRRLNLWQKSANPFIQEQAWSACAASYSLEAMAGIGGGMGLDLSRVSDLTAAVFCGRDEDGNIRLWPKFWLPEETAQKLEHLVPYEDWRKAGYITLVEGEIINFDRILEDVCETIETIGTQYLVYDKTFAEDFTARIEEECGIQRFAMNQTFNEYARPTEDFERFIISTDLMHPTNAVLDWQIGHCMVKTVADKRKPLKDEAAPWKTIDGVQASIMSILALTKLDEDGNGRSVYEEEQVLWVG